MKRFLIASICLALLWIGFEYLVYYEGFYLDFGSETEIEVPFRTAGMEYQCEMPDGTYKTMIFQGVDVSASTPGSPAMEFSTDEKTYLRWFEEIGEMGANLVRVISIMDDSFYNALYTYNTTHEEPIYLLQGSSISDRANDGPEDAYSLDYYGTLLENSLIMVDVVHGRKNLMLGAMQGSGRYRRDVSPWVAGWLIGASWNSGTAAYTINSSAYDGQYQGTYFVTDAQANSFEAMLAQVMDQVTEYETAKYHTQRPIGFINAQDTDFLVYEEIYASQLQKYVQLDAEKVHPTQQMQAGCYAAYRLYDFCDGFANYLIPQQQRTLASVLKTIEEDDPYGGYLKVMAEHHSMPVLVTGYGFSTSRNPISKEQEPLTEEQQGQALMQVYQKAVEAGWSGAIISSWQDTWERWSWNTAFATVLNRNTLWHDLQCDNQNYGLLAFEPGAEPLCQVDGDPSEWTEEDVVVGREDAALSVRYDAQGLYLMLQGEKITPEQTLYVPIDTTPKSGSKIYGELVFERAADFILCLNGTQKTRLLVQSRYHAMTENFGWEIGGPDPFIYPPETDDSEFETVGTVLKNCYLLNEEEFKSAADKRRELQKLGVWETGNLVHGVADPYNKDYNSLADFCFGENCVEILLPWEMLNVGDPSQLLIHDDYYENYGVDMMPTDGFYFGIALAGEEQPAKMEPFCWSGWTQADTCERLKQSYYVIQEVWS